jgi:Raf kinase inhibitor-like YbhB/YbcL family protein
MPTLPAPFVYAALLSAALLSAAAAASATPARHFVLWSPDPLVAEHMPETYIANASGCTGRNASPPLQWKGAPKGTLSYVVTLFDRDERSTPSGWWHWVVYDIPKDVDSLYIGAGALHSQVLPPPTLQGRSDGGEEAYQGPCPPKGDPPHRYVFTVYALKVAKLPVPEDSSGAMVTATAQDYVLAKSVFIAHYGRRK